jgi:hypothetical protein
MDADVASTARQQRRSREIGLALRCDGLAGSVVAVEEGCDSPRRQSGNAGWCESVRSDADLQLGHDLLEASGVVGPSLTAGDVACAEGAGDGLGIDGAGLLDARAGNCSQIVA